MKTTEAFIVFVKSINYSFDELKWLTLKEIDQLNLPEELILKVPKEKLSVDCDAEKHIKEIVEEKIGFSTNGFEYEMLTYWMAEEVKQAEIDRIHNRLKQNALTGKLSHLSEKDISIIIKICNEEIV